MGFFSNLFAKKNCDICGGEIGLLGNRKLADGNLCKNCAAKLSPWFSERRQSTVEEIAQQLEYREQNKAEVSTFHITRTLGRYTKVLIDEDAGKFIITSAKNLNEANPDVLALSQVTGCDLDIRESRTEDTYSRKKDDGTSEQVSYDPPHYTYRYDFHMTVYVNHPYFSQMSFDLNSGSVDIETVGPIGSGVRPMGRPHNGPGMVGTAGAVLDALGTLANLTSGPSMECDPRMSNQEYVNYLNMGNEIKAALTKVSDQAREVRAAETMPKQAVTCPACGATTFPDANGCCEYCGSSLRG